MIRLTTKQVIPLHSSLIEATGGTDGVRDMGLLESALEAPFQTFGGMMSGQLTYQKQSSQALMI